MKRFVTICLFSALTVLSVSAQSRRLLPPGGCFTADGDAARTRAVATRASSPAMGDICIPIILAAYSDVPFTVPNVQQVWNDIANQPGYSEHGAHGSMRDYFFEQSRGQFRVTFDVLGPVTLPEKREFYGANTKYATDNRATTMIKDACQKAIDQGADFSRYDWNGDGSIESVLVVYAGPGENVVGAPAEYVWPKSGYAPYAVGGKFRLSLFACTNELVWPDMRQDGFGTLLHEFSHCLGLPDLYNVDETVDDYIVFDEWDLMDGGCYSGGGWQPVGYSAYERYLCGWLEPEELLQPTAIDDLRPLTDGGSAYLVRNDAKSDECYMLENRQWQSFDYALPGHGLLVTHISEYGSSSLFPNSGENVIVYPVLADNRSFVDCLRDYVQEYYHAKLPNDVFSVPREYRDSLDDAFGRTRLMTQTAYPYVVDGTILNDRLTDDSTPAAVTLSPNAAGRKLLSRPITDIRENDGLISFRFISSADAIHEATTWERLGHSVAYYDLHGRRLTNPARGTLCVARYPDGTIKKIFR